MKRKNGVLYTLLIALFVYALLTWILPVTTFSGEFQSQGMVRMGINDMISYPTYTFYNFIYIFVYLGLVCCLYGLLRKIPAYRNFVSKVVSLIKDRNLFFTILTILVLTVVIAFNGFTYELLAIMPFIATVVLKAGKDKFTALLTTVGPIAVGIMSNLFASSVAGVFVNGLAINYNDLLIAKLLLLIIGVALLVVTIKLHEKKVEEKEELDDVFFLYEDEKEDKKSRVWPLAVTFGFFVLVKLIASISWNETFGLAFFNELKERFDAIPFFSKYIAFIVFGLTIIGLLVKYIVNKKKDNKKKFIETLGKFGFVVFIISSIILGVVFIKVMLEDVFKVTTIFSDLYSKLSLEGATLGTFFGSLSPFGSWTYAEYIILLIILGICLMIGYRIKPSEVVENAGHGFRGGLYALVLCMLGYIMLVASSNNPVMLTILKPLLTLTKGFNVLIYSLASFVSGLFNSDFSYFNYGIVNLTYVTATYGDKTNLFPLIGLVNQSMYGLALLVAPTSIPLIFGLGTLNYSYKKWFKFIWKLFLGMFIAALLINVIVLILI